MSFVTVNLCISTVEWGEHGHHESGDPIFVVRQKAQGYCQPRVRRRFTQVQPTRRLTALLPALSVLIDLWSILLVWL
jgi:hypothetical protein